MGSESINADFSENFDNIIGAISNLGIAELEKIKEAINLSIARKKAPFLPKKEEELINKIYNELPKKMRIRYDELFEKHQTKMIKSERKELDELTAKFLKRDNERLEAMIELAQIKNISVDNLMKELQLSLPFNA